MSKALIIFLLAAGFASSAAWEIGPGTEGLITNVSLLLADHFSVQCFQIFHGKNLTFQGKKFLYETWKRLTDINKGKQTGVYTFDNYAWMKRLNSQRVNCYRSMKIITDDEDSKRGYASLTKEFSIKDAVWVLFLKTLSVSFFEHADVMFDDFIIIGVVETLEFIQFYEVYRVNNSFPLRILWFGNWTMEGGLTTVTESLYDRRTNLEGVVMRAGLIENWPASFMKNGIWDGFVVRVWQEIQQLINSTSIFIRCYDDFIGMRLPNGSWNGLMGMAVRNEIDVIVGEVAIDKERSKAVQFLYPIMKTRFQIYTKYMEFKWKWVSVLKPFHVSVWVAAVGWIVVVTILLTFTYKVCLRHGVERFDSQQAFTPTTSFFFVLQSLCQQGYHLIPHSGACKIIFFVSYAVSGVLIPSYSASLVSFLAQKPEFTTFDSIQDMVADGKYRLQVTENSMEHGFFMHTKDGFFKKAYNTLAKSVPEKFKKTGIRGSITNMCADPKYALFAMEEKIKVQLFRNSTFECNIVPLKYPVSNIHLTMATTKRFPYWGLLNHQVQKLINRGVVARWKHAAFPPYDHSRTQMDKEVGLHQVISAFVFMGFFIVVSAVLLLMEIVHYLHKNRKFKLKGRVIKSRPLFPVSQILRTNLNRK